MSFEDNITDNKAPCQGCPVMDKCPVWIEHMSKECLKFLKERGEWEE
jgi:hypothetical protein